MLVAGALGGMLWAAIPALLRTRFNANEILVSLMLVYVASLILSLLVHGAWRDPEGFNFPQSKMFPDAALLPILVDGTRLNVGLPARARRAWLACWLFMSKSFLGFQMRVRGLSAEPRPAMPVSRRRAPIWIGMLSGGSMRRHRRHVGKSRDRSAS